jgi:DTW domain-containing protein YfiP
MSRRDHRAERCDACQLYRALCICALIPRLTTRARLALLVHYREARKPTTTGLLAARCVERSDVHIVGDRDRPLPASLVREGELPLLLYPAEDAAPIAPFAAASQPIVLIVPDGNWRQAGKMRRRVPGLGAVTCVTLPESGGSSYRLRAEPKAGGLATLEAIARALGILEGDPAIEAAMLGVFRVMVERTLWLRGALPRDAVTGGIPDQ